MDGMNRGLIWDAVPAPAWRNWRKPNVYTRISRLWTEIVTRYLLWIASAVHVIGTLTVDQPWSSAVAVDTLSFWGACSKIMNMLTNYHHLQVYQSKCLRVIGDFPRRTLISNLHAHIQIIPISQFIYHLTDKFFVSCTRAPKPPHS